MWSQMLTEHGKDKIRRSKFETPTTLFLKTHAENRRTRLGVSRLRNRPPPAATLPPASTDDHTEPTPELQCERPLPPASAPPPPDKVCLRPPFEGEPGLLPRKPPFADKSTRLPSLFIPEEHTNAAPSETVIAQAQI